MTTPSTQDRSTDLIERRPPPGLSIAEVFAANPCDWICYTKAKAGPQASWWCKACGKFSKTRACPSLSNSVERN